MQRFLAFTELYDMVQRMSQEAKEVLWVCSPYLGFDAHEVFSQEIIKSPPLDVRFVFRVNDSAVKSGEVDPLEVQYFMDHFGNNSVRSHDDFNSKIYIFDKSALITSANLTKTAFESNIEVGVMLEDSQAVCEIKNFFDQNLWQTARPISDLRKYKQIWNKVQKSPKNNDLKKAKPHTKIKNWTDDYVNTWYIGVPFQMSTKTKRKIMKETNWPNKLSILGDVGIPSFRQLKLGDLAYLANLNKKRGKIEIERARIFDKSKVETDQGDLHAAYEAENTYLLEREQFYEMLKNANIGSRTFETTLDPEQLKIITNVLSSLRHKRRRKS